MNQAEAEASGNETSTFVVGVWGVRYQVKDVARAVAFYTQQLGFKLDQQNLPAFAQVSIGNLKQVLSGPGASGSRPMPDGRSQEPGGWNRLMLQVTNLPDRSRHSRVPGCISATKWKLAQAANKFNWKTLMAIPLNYLNPRDAS